MFIHEFLVKDEADRKFDNLPVMRYAFCWKLISHARAEVLMSSAWTKREQLSDGNDYPGPSWSQRANYFLGGHCDLHIVAKDVVTLTEQVAFSASMLDEVDVLQYHTFHFTSRARSNCAFVGGMTVKMKDGSEVIILRNGAAYHATAEDVSARSKQKQLS